MPRYRGNIFKIRCSLIRLYLSAPYSPPSLSVISFSVIPIDFFLFSACDAALFLFFLLSTILSRSSFYIDSVFASPVLHIHPLSIGYIYRVFGASTVPPFLFLYLSLSLSFSHLPSFILFLPYRCVHPSAVVVAVVVPPADEGASMRAIGHKG